MFSVIYVLDLGSQGEDVHRVETVTFENKNSSDSGSTELHTVIIPEYLRGFCLVAH